MFFWLAHHYVSIYHYISIYIYHISISLYTKSLIYHSISTYLYIYISYIITYLTFPISIYLYIYISIYIYIYLYILYHTLVIPLYIPIIDIPIIKLYIYTLNHYIMEYISPSYLYIIPTEPPHAVVPRVLGELLGEEWRVRRQHGFVCWNLSSLGLALKVAKYYRKPMV